MFSFHIQSQEMNDVYMILIFGDQSDSVIGWQFQLCLSSNENCQQTAEHDCSLSSVAEGFSVVTVVLNKHVGLSKGLESKAHLI